MTNDFHVIIGCEEEKIMTRSKRLVSLFALAITALACAIPDIPMPGQGAAAETSSAARPKA